MLSKIAKEIQDEELKIKAMVQHILADAKERYDASLPMRQRMMMMVETIIADAKKRNDVSLTKVGCLCLCESVVTSCHFLCSLH